MLRRCTSDSGVSRGTSTSLRRSLSVTSATRSINERLVPCAIAAIVPIEHGHTTMPSVCTEPDAGCAPRSASLNRRMQSHSPVALRSPASSLMPHSSASRRQPCVEISSQVGTRCFASASSKRTAYGAPDAPVIASISGVSGVGTVRNIPSGVGRCADVNSSYPHLFEALMFARIRSLGIAFAALLPLGVAAQQAPVNGNSAATAPTPPVAAVRPHTFNEFGKTRTDEYYWLKERSNPEVIRYLEAENAYTKAMMAHTDALQERLYEEMKGRVLQNDQSVPFREGGYYYYTRLVDGKNYPIYARKKGSPTAPEEIMIDVNELAEGKATYIIRDWEVSSGQDILAFLA